MTETDRGYYGHKTLADGSHVPLTKDEAAEIIARIEASEAKRAADMPTARDALAELIRAEQRLKDLGWWRGGGLRVRRGDDCAVVEQGSTGMWSGHYQADGKYVLFADCVKGPRDVWLKPLADLTPEERAWMAECDKSVSDDIERMGAVLGGSSDEGE